MHRVCAGKSSERVLASVLQELVFIGAKSSELRATTRPPFKNFGVGYWSQQTQTHTPASNLCSASIIVRGARPYQRRVDGVECDKRSVLYRAASAHRIA